MASEPSSSSSAGSFDDDRLPLHTIGHATRHTLPPRTLLGRVVYSAAAAVAAAVAAAAVAAASRPPLSRSVSSLFARMWPHRQSYLFLPSFFSRVTPPPSALPVSSFILTPLAPPSRGSFSFPFLHLEAPSPFFNEIEIAMESVARISFLSSFTSPSSSFLLSFSRFVLAVSRNGAGDWRWDAERDKESSTANAVC